MKKLIIWIIVIVLGLHFFAPNVLETILGMGEDLFQSPNTVAIKFVSADLVQNNSVGNEWNTVVIVNGVELQKRKKVVFPDDEVNSIQIVARATEYDSIPDIGTNSITVPIENLSHSKTEKIINVTVTENRGRYSGHKAKWEFTVDINKK